MKNEQAGAAAHVISGHWLKKLLALSSSGAVDVSLDLGRSVATVELRGRRFILPNGVTLDSERIRRAKFQPEDCFIATADGLKKIYRFSRSSGRYYKLYHPRPEWPPTIVINNAPMHAMLDCSPADDARMKLAAVAQAGGAGKRSRRNIEGKTVLDTCFGLGYTATAAIELRAARVVSCEVDRNVLEIARLNPWSASVFMDERVEILNCDSHDYLAGAPPGRFDIVIHDPPTITMAGELYSSALYAELRRVLKPGGRLYHYTGAPGARLGHDLAGRIARRISSAGFVKISRARGGLTAIKK